MEIVLRFIVENDALVAVQVVESTPTNTDPIQCTLQVNQQATITKQEKRIWGMLATGQNVKEIATELNLSIKTVEAHKFNLMRKLGVHNRAQLTILAVKQGIIELP